MANTFAPQRPILAQLAAQAQPFFKAIREIVLGVDLQEMVNYKRAEREHLRKPLFVFEGRLEKLRKSVAEGHIKIVEVTPELREWVAYDRATFYAQLVRLYQRQGLWADVERVKQVFAKGAKYTSIVKDEHGNEVGSETITEPTKKARGNAVELEF